MRMSEFCRLVEREPMDYVDGAIRAFTNDTRTMEAGDVFVAIRTDRNDGNRYLAQARDSGAFGYLASRMPDGADGYRNLFLTRDPVGLLGRAAGRWIREQAAQRIGITGSAGKTTTKQLTAAMLAQGMRTACSEGNFNNTIGLPLTILNRLSTPVDAYVAEMGMSTPGEIARLVELVRPQVRVWLNVMPAHVGNFPSVEAIRDAKAEILESRDADDVVVYNGDDILVKDRVAKTPGIRYAFGHGDDCDLQILDSRVRSLTEGELIVRYEGKTFRFRHHLPGPHHAGNMAAALLTAAVLGVPVDAAGKVLASFQPVERRGQVLTIGPVTVYDDCYNANPHAVKSVLGLLAEAPVPGRRIAVLGDMLELGEQSVMRHREIGRYINTLPLDHVILFGPEMAAAAQEVRRPCTWLETGREAAAQTAALVRPADTVLVKASRGMHAEVVVEALRERWA